MRFPFPRDREGSLLLDEGGLRENADTIVKKRRRQEGCVWLNGPDVIHV